MFFHSAYNLTIASTRRLLYLTEISPAQSADVVITFEQNAHVRLPKGDFYEFWDSDEGYGFSVELSAGWAQYVICSDGTCMHIKYSADECFDEVVRYLIGVVLGALLRCKGILCLHASAVSVGDAAIAFVGASRAGKSTLAAAFHRQNLPLLSEDITAIDADDGYHVRPGFFAVRLHPETADYLYGAVGLEQARPVTAVSHKAFYPLKSQPVQRSRLGSICLLAPRNPNLQAPRLLPIPKPSAVMLLSQNLYLYPFAGQQWFARDFSKLGHLVQNVPVYLLEQTDRLADLQLTIDLF